MTDFRNNLLAFIQSMTIWHVFSAEPVWGLEVMAVNETKGALALQRQPGRVCSDNMQPHASAGEVLQGPGLGVGRGCPDPGFYAENRSMVLAVR